MSPERTVVQHTGVPWWIILVAVLAGILILALLVFLLWKVSTDKFYLTDGHQGKKKEMSTQTSYDQLVKIITNKK